MIEKCRKLPKDGQKRRRQVRFNEKGNRACDKGENNDDQKIYSSMARMSSNDERSSKKYGDSSQLINWILDSGATCHMNQKFRISFQDHQRIRINTLKLRTDITSRRNKKIFFIATLHSVLLSPDLCNRLFSIITLVNSGHNYLFTKGFAQCTQKKKRKIQ